MAERRAAAPDPEPATDRPGAWPAARPGTRLRGESGLVLLLLVLLAILLTWPATAHLGSTVIDLGDPLLTTWILAWDLHALAVAPLRFFDANMFHPQRWALAYTEPLLGLVPLAGVARLAGAGPLLAHNLLWLATFPLTGLAMFWLVRHLTGHSGAAALAAVLYAFSPFRFGQLGHVQILSHQWLPLMLLGLHRAARSGGAWKDVGLAGGALALQALSSGYQAFFAAITGAVFLGWLALPASRPPLTRLFARGVVAGVAVGVLLLPPILAYRFARDEAALARSAMELQHYVATPRSYLAAPAENRWLGTATARFRTREAALFPGVLTLGLAGAGVVIAVRRSTAGRGTSPPDSRQRRWPPALDVALAVAIAATAINWLLVGGIALRLGPLRISQRDFGAPVLLLAVALAVRRLVQGEPRPIRGLGALRWLGWPNAVGLYLALTAVGVLASFGPTLALGSSLELRPLYAQLYRLVPGFDALRVPGRFGVVVTTGLAGLAGLGAAGLLPRLPRPRWRMVALVALGGFAVLEAWAVPLRLVSVAPEPGPADAWLARQPGAGAVVVLPMYALPAAHFESLRLVGSIAHWRPLVNGYAGVFPASYASDVATLNTFPAPAAVARLRALYVRFVVVYLGQYPDAERARLDAALETLPPGVAGVAAFEATRIFEIGAEAPRAAAEGAKWADAARSRARDERDEARRGLVDRILGARTDGRSDVVALAQRLPGDAGARDP